MARILVIDDDDALRPLLIDALALEHDAIGARDGMEGIKLAEAYQPDLIVCDINMPRMNGFEVLSAFQKIDQMADIPFIFLSAIGDHHTIRQGMTLGADDFLTKPINIAELHYAVRSRLEKRARRQNLVAKAIDELRMNVTTALPHELRTAIMIMEGYACLVLEDAETLDPLQRNMVEGIRDNAARLRHMAEKYLWYLQTHLPGGLDTESVTENPDQVVQQIAFAMAQRFGRASDLHLHLEAAHVGIKDEYIGRMAEELIENACKFSKAGTPVSVTAEASEHGYSLAVQNIGRPITPEEIEQIGGFVQFNRERYEQQGTGLGLIIVKRLTEACGGQLNIESTDGVTTVMVTLPLITIENRERLTFP